ncbi:hypothetical protein PM082_013242 [Marasmius tenuissimus]|nr:hypothetical protein PM082_013242 [Marasmius tenuissimus]
MQRLARTLTVALSLAGSGLITSANAVEVISSRSEPPTISSPIISASGSISTNQASISSSEVEAAVSGRPRTSLADGLDSTVITLPGGILFTVPVIPGSSFSIPEFPSILPTILPTGLSRGPNQDGPSTSVSVIVTTSTSVVSEAADTNGGLATAFSAKATSGLETTASPTNSANSSNSLAKSTEMNFLMNKIVVIAALMSTGVVVYF